MRNNQNIPIYKAAELVVVYQVVWCLFRQEDSVQTPGQTSPPKRNEMKEYFVGSTTPQKISGKNCESKIKIAMKSFSKNLSFGVGFKL